MTSLLVTFLAAFTSNVASQQMLDLILFPENTSGAQCLDGSPAGFFYGPPPTGSSDLWVIFVEGGGDCHTESECKKRYS